jgi:hypothetical protein
LDDPGKSADFPGSFFRGRGYFLFSIKGAALRLQIAAQYAIIKIKYPLAVKKGDKKERFIYGREKKRHQKVP